MKETIHIYHTNDLHSHFENWPRIRSFLQKRKQWHEEEKEAVYLFDIGDHVDRSHPFTEGTLGKGNVELLNKVNYDAVTIGNNEGITLDYSSLYTLYDQATFDVTIANLYNKEKEYPKWMEPHLIYETSSGVRIGVIGVTAYFQPFYSSLGWNITDPFLELQAQLDRIRKKTDIIVVLSHLGIHDDEKMAQEFPEIDLILGAHTHHILHAGKEVNQTLLGAAGKFGFYVGHVMIEVDTEDHTIISKTARLYEHHELPETSNEKQEIEQWFELGKTQLQKPVAHLNTALTVDWFRPSPLAQLLSDAILEWCQADCAFLNAGLLLDSLPKGNVTKYDLHQILPHPINPCTVELTGAELKEVLRQTLDPEMPHIQVKGLGFRGKIMGTFLYSNVLFSKENQSLRIGDKDMDPKKTYTVATVDMFTFGHFFPELHRAKKHYFMPEFLRDILEWKLNHRR